jgi:hypothetical protein
MNLSENSLPGRANLVLSYLLGPDLGNVPILSQAPTNSVLNPEKKLKSSEDTKSS